MTALLLFGSLLLAPDVEAQHPPWPDGCSVLLPFYVQQGLDAIFLEACDVHDLCWAECATGPNPPYLGLAHRQQCDVNFLHDMETACVLEAAFIVFPAGGFDDAQDFIQHCSGVAATFYGAVATPFGTGIFWTSQCTRGCNLGACATLEVQPPPTCGNGFGPYFCYLMPEPPPQPPPDLCDLIDCDEYCGTPIGVLCCPGCGGPTPCLTAPDEGEANQTKSPGAAPVEIEPDPHIWNCGC